MSGTNTFSLIGNFTKLNLFEDMLIGKYFLYSQKGLNIYWLSLLPGFLHNVNVSSLILPVYAVSGIKVEMGKREDLTDEPVCEPCYISGIPRQFI